MVRRLSNVLYFSVLIEAIWFDPWLVPPPLSPPLSMKRAPVASAQLLISPRLDAALFS